jgi:hypothetical protein
MQTSQRARGSGRFAWHPEALISSWIGREGAPRLLRRKKIVSFHPLLSLPRLPARIALTPGPRQSVSHSHSDQNLTVKMPQLFMPFISKTRQNRWANREEEVAHLNEIESFTRSAMFPQLKPYLVAGSEAEVEEVSSCQGRRSFDRAHCEGNLR